MGKYEYCLRFNGSEIDGTRANDLSEILLSYRAYGGMFPNKIDISEREVGDWKSLSLVALETKLANERKLIETGQ